MGAFRHAEFGLLCLQRAASLGWTRVAEWHVAQFPALTARFSVFLVGHWSKFVAAVHVLWIVHGSASQW